MNTYENGIVPITENQYWDFLYNIKNDPGVDSITERVCPCADENKNRAEGLKTTHVFIGTTGELPANSFSPQEVILFESPKTLADNMKSDGVKVQIWKFVVKPSDESSIGEANNKTTILKLGGTIKYHPGLFNLTDFEVGVKNSR